MTRPAIEMESIELGEILPDGRISISAYGVRIGSCTVAHRTRTTVTREGRGRTAPAEVFAAYGDPDMQSVLDEWLAWEALDAKKKDDAKAKAEEAERAAMAEDVWAKIEARKAQAAAT